MAKQQDPIPIPTRVVFRRLERSDMLADVAVDRVQRAFREFAPRVRKAKVRFDDINGPHHGGEDKRAKVHLSGPKLERIRVSAVAATFAEALSLAIERAKGVLRKSHSKRTRPRDARRQARALLETLQPVPR